MDIAKLYGELEKRIPRSLSCEWDNDGIMCMSCPEKEVNKVLFALDITEDAVDYAIENGYDCIISHHPLVFAPIKGIDVDNAVSRKLCKLIKNDIAAFSFHTRFDKWKGGVNDAMVRAFQIEDGEDEPFSDIGKIFYPEESSVKEFAQDVKDITGSPSVLYVDAGKTVKKVAVVCGSGKGYLQEAIDCGCDTFLTGEMPYNCEIEAKESGINLVCAGHHYSEDIIYDSVKILMFVCDDTIKVDYFNSNPSFYI